MNGEVVCGTDLLSIPSCTVSTPVVHHDNAITAAPEEGECSPPRGRRNHIQRQDDGWRENGLDSEAESRRSPCWPDGSTSLLRRYSATTSRLRCPRQARGVSDTDRLIKAKKTGGGKNCQIQKITDFFPKRRSNRQSKTELKLEQKQLIDDLITRGIEEGMRMQYMEGKGRAVFSTRRFRKGEYVVEYHGDLLGMTDAKKREAEYAQNPETGCYMYYFQHLCITYCVDATKETGRLGRLINHSKKGNCQTKVHDIQGVPHLILVAARDIEDGEELLYDYGDRSKASIAAHPWLKH
ncbi:N-lysine methyltransferase KMT5A-A [Nerophis ophidion]|uniref:N-lysine methyltransferase KMT5A-A n=1 Tax=Nerophis ophidion TaxID=159077 RepID=UPI002ADF17EF|nr:N-lysine methyltransferase KMT5A-A [Nerophis ophidion]